MYNLRGNQPSGSSKCVEPSWEEIYAKQREEFEIIKNFQNSLIALIKVIGFHNANELAKLLGTVQLDLIQRESEIERLSEKI